MTGGDARRSVPLLRAAVLALGLALALTACAGSSSPPAGQTAPASAQPAVARSGAVIPGAARQVTLSLKYGANAGSRKPPAPVTVTSSVKVSAVAGFVTIQPPSPSGTYNCPSADGMALIATFRAQPDGPALATATLALNGCEGTDLTVGAKDYALGEPDSARSLAARVLKAAGVPWTLPPASWPMS
jgi:hypothetical protein